jgi:uncharacterized repeat protein (TIGR03847 family)
LEGPEHDYGRAYDIDAEAIGQPGQRRFRLLIRSEHGSAAIWMEKQQIDAIGLWFQEALERLDRDQPSSEPDQEPTLVPEPFDLEFHANQVGLGFAEGANLFAMQAFDDATVQTDPRPTFRCFLTRGQCRVLSRKIAAVVAAGRPICPLCEMPMDPAGHVCAKSNGHHLG